MRIFRFILFLIALALLFVSVTQLLSGYNDWQEAQVLRQRYNDELQMLEVQRAQLKHRVDLLKNDTLTKERLVRKRFGYVKPGEIKIKIVKPIDPE